MNPLIETLNVRAITAYERQDASVLPGLRSLGAAMALHGISENGGLVGGGIENIFFSRNCPRSTTPSQDSDGSVCPTSPRSSPGPVTST